MAVKYLTNIDFNKNQILNAAAQNLAAAPGTPVLGQFYYDTAANKLFVWNGISWASADASVGSGVTSVAALTLGTTGTDLTSTIANGNTTPVITLNVPNASAANRGALTSTDWSRFDGKEPAITKNTGFNLNLETSTANIKMNGAAAVGVLSTLARADHIHATDTNRAATIHNLVDTTNHPVSGLTNGHFLKATGAATYAFAAHGLTPTDISLGNVTNDAQMKKIASSTAGNIPTWADTNGNLLAAGYTVETTLTGGTGAIPRADAVKTYIDGSFAVNDAMLFKGTIGTGGTHTIAAFNALVIYNAGWTYKVIEAGTIKGIVCEIGDMLIATVDRASAGVNADWVVTQTNLDGVVVGPASAVADNFVGFNSTTGKLIKDSGFSSASFAPAGAAKKYAVDLSTSATSYTVTHNLNTRDIVVSVYELATPWAQVYSDVEHTSVNTITVKFAVAPAINTYRVVVVG